MTILPRRGEITLTTTRDDQQTAEIEIREGSRPRASDNLPLMSLILEGLPPGRAGTLEIKVSVEVDRYLREVTLEAFESQSGASARKTVERGVLTYGDGVLEAQEAAEERCLKDDEALRRGLAERVLMDLKVRSCRSS